MATKAFSTSKAKTDGYVSKYFERRMEIMVCGLVWGEQNNFLYWQYHLWLSKTEYNKGHHKDCFSMSFNILLPSTLARNEKFYESVSTQSNVRSSRSTQVKIRLKVLARGNGLINT